MLSRHGIASEDPSSLLVAATGTAENPKPQKLLKT
jgi:hypothetical protein